MVSYRGLNDDCVLVENIRDTWYTPSCVVCKSLLEMKRIRAFTSCYQPAAENVSHKATISIWNSNK